MTLFCYNHLNKPHRPQNRLIKKKKKRTFGGHNANSNELLLLDAVALWYPPNSCGAYACSIPFALPLFVPAEDGCDWNAGNWKPERSGTPALTSMLPLRGCGCCSSGDSCE